METTLLSTTDCRHHWLLGQPEDGAIAGECRSCGARRHFPAYLEDLDGDGVFRPSRQQGIAATAVGGARPSPQP